MEPLLEIKPKEFNRLPFYTRSANVSSKSGWNYPGFDFEKYDNISFNYNSIYSSLTRHNIIAKRLSDISEITSSTGEILIRFQNQDEFTCSSIKSCIYQAVGGMIETTYIFSDLKSLKGELSQFENVNTIAAGGLHYARLKNEYTLKQWNIISLIRPYQRCYQERTIWEDFDGEGYRFFCEKAHPPFTVSLEISNNEYCHWSINIEDTSPIRSDHDGGFECDFLNYIAYAYVRFFSIEDLHQYINKIRKAGYNINLKEKEKQYAFNVIEGSIIVNKSLQEVSRDLNIIFEYSYSCYTQSCDYPRDRSRWNLGKIDIDLPF